MSSNYNLLLVSQLLSIKDKSVNFITFNNISCFFLKMIINNHFVASDRLTSPT